MVSLKEMGSTIENVPVLPEASCRAAAEEISVTKTTLEVRLRERATRQQESIPRHFPSGSFPMSVGHGDV